MTPINKPPPVLLLLPTSYHVKSAFEANEFVAVRNKTQHLMNVNQRQINNRSRMSQSKHLHLLFYVFLVVFSTFLPTNAALLADKKLFIAISQFVHCSTTTMTNDDDSMSDNKSISKSTTTSI